LKKHIQRVFARACLKQQESASPNPIIVDEDNLAEFVDEPVPPSRRYYEEHLPIGVSVGLAKTNYGGSIQYVESVPWLTGDKGVEAEEEDNVVHIAAAPKDKKKKNIGPGGKLKVTGQTGDVMKESTQVALTFAKNFLATHQPSNQFFLKNNIHLHFPEGAMPKDGPSAGVTIVTSLLSLAINKPLAREIAMTGEVTLSGKVLPVGGIKEKAIAAKIHGINEIILPSQNETEWDLEIPGFVKENLTVHFVDTYAEMFEIVFGYHIHTIPLFDSRRIGGDFIIGSKDTVRDDYPTTRV
jgi:ATP-dependent Lon protease